MVLRYITTKEFLEGQSGVIAEIGPNKCFPTIQHLEFFIESIEQMIDNYLGRRLNQQDYIEKFWGSCSRMRNTKNYPINNVSSISYIRVGDTIPVVIDPSKYLVSSTEIIYPNEFYSDFYYTIEYNAGWPINEIPVVIKQAIIEQVGLTLLEHPRGVLKSESGNNSKLIFEMTPLPLWPQIEQKLRPYKRVNFYL